MGCLPERPWDHWSRGKPLTQQGLAELLEPFKIKSGNIREGGKVFKGYRRAAFEDVWSRYLPPVCSALPPSSPNEGALQPLQVNENNNLCEIPGPLQTANVAPRESVVTIGKINIVAPVAGPDSPMGKEGATKGATRIKTPVPPPAEPKPRRVKTPVPPPPGERPKLTVVKSPVP